jgi:hypothetical protein
MKNTSKVLPILLVVCNTIFAQKNVGIGVLSPTEKLQVDSGNIKIGKTQWLSAADNIYLKFGDGNFARIGEAVNDDILVFNARDYLFYSPDYTDARMGIGISTSPSARLEVNGNVKITDGTQGTGKVLTSDSFGMASWQQPANFNSGFKATSSSNIILASGSSLTPAFAVEEYDDGSAYAAGSFTAPAAGLYHFDAAILWDITSTATYADFTFWISSSGGGTSHFDARRVPAGSSGNFTQSVSCDFKLTAGQVVQINMQQNSGVNQTIIGNFSNNKFSYFSGHRVY